MKKCDNEDCIFNLNYECSKENIYLDEYGNCTTKIDLFIIEGKRVIKSSDYFGRKEK